MSSGLFWWLFKGRKRRRIGCWAVANNKTLVLLICAAGGLQQIGGCQLLLPLFFIFIWFSCLVNFFFHCKELADWIWVLYGRPDLRVGHKWLNGTSRPLATITKLPLFLPSDGQTIQLIRFQFAISSSSTDRDNQPAGFRTDRCKLQAFWTCRPKQSRRGFSLFPLTYRQSNSDGFHL